MKRLLALAALVLALALSACAGYSITSKDGGTLALAPEYRTLFLKSVENPTLKPGVSADLRSRLRDEFSRRGGITWVDRDKAAAYLHVKVVSFTTSAAITDEDDETLKSSASISMEAWITKKSDGSELWRGAASHSETFLTDREQAEEDVIEHAARKLADRLSQNY
ncbi:LPS assembly lipoprotein LptE [Desulfocurvus sp. DL9XJH121]